MNQSLKNIVLRKKPNELLLQSPPFLFVDRVLDFESENKKISCAKYLAYNENYFSGHFPALPMVPGVLIIEMAAQASMLLIIGLLNAEEPTMGYLVKANKFTFITPAYPGDCLKIHATMVRQIGVFMTTKVEVISELSNKRIAKGELVLTLPSGN